MAMAQSQNPMQQNAIARAAMAGRGVQMRQKIGTFGPFAMGSTNRIRLLNAGVLTKLTMEVTATVTIATATVTPSSCGPYNLFSTVNVIDYNQVDRVKTDGYSLQALQGIKYRRYYNDSSAALVSTGLLEVPTTVGTGTLHYIQDIPLAYDAEGIFGGGPDYRGAVLAQTVVGEQFLQLTLPSAGQGADPIIFPYATGTGTATITNVYVTLYQEYTQPATLADLPLLDLQTIYEIKGNYISSTNIASNTTKYVDYPNVRSVLSSLCILEDNTALATATEFNQIRLIANGNTNLRESSYSLNRQHLRNALGGDLAHGVFYTSSRQQPVSTALYGNVQLALDFATITGGGSTYLQTQFESFYPAGTPLPGVQTAG